MRIYSMTATFGKLNHQTLQLQPGLNVIHAPNEWGKSTWCAFLIAMLYGIETNKKTTKTALADKERYDPWSGEPMSGRIELNWNGRDITIERSTKGRVPFGQFRAYETATGLDVPELTGANCGQQLLGVERSVFTRAGFVSLQDMPVTQDEFLRRRLNNLVTTGDESGAGEQLGKQLRDLKNSIRYNRSGQLPQAEVERDQIRSQLEQKEALQQQTKQLEQRQGQLEDIIKALENHAVALRYEAAKEGVLQIKAADETCRRLQNEVDELEAECAGLPDARQAEAAIGEGQELLAQQRALLTSRQQLPPEPMQPNIPVLYQNILPEQAIKDAESDFTRYKAAETACKKLRKLPLFAGIGTAALILAVIICGVAFSLQPAMTAILAGAIAAIGIAAIVLCSLKTAKLRKEKELLCQKRPGIPPEEWVPDARKYGKAQETYQIALEQHKALCGDFDQRQQLLDDAIAAYGDGKDLEQAISHWETILQQMKALSDKRSQLQNATKHAAALQSVATAAPEPAFPDALKFTAEETDSYLKTARFEQQQLQIKLGECIGQANTLRPEAVLKEQLEVLNRRIGKLEDYYRALELAQEVLHQATSALQRRFAPRINKQAQEYFSRMTGGRYQRLALSDDLSLHASAENEDVMRSAQWRSDGTIDQLYLSLRLAVAGEITPDAPLVLDDALLRFDDERLKSTMAVLKEIAENKQVILFSCQSRESKEIL